MDLKVANSDVRFALSSVEETYISTKALEYCSENFGKYNLGSIDAVTKNCVNPLAKILNEQLQNGYARRLQDFLNQKVAASVEDISVTNILIWYRNIVM